jgi:hypothetical protein
VDLDKLPEQEKPSKVLVIIYTDGYENSSKKYTNQRINEMIAHQRNVYSWEFLFLAASQDAIAQGSSMGIPSTHCVQTESTDVGNLAVGETVFAMASCYSNQGAGALEGMDKASFYRMSVSKETKKRERKLP